MSLHGQEGTPRPKVTPPRIQSLDGLRAISIALVLVYHLAGTRNFPISNEEALPFDIGNFGVVVFFVISGFLITTLLLGELERKGDISLRRFYFRRAARIFPAYYVYLAVIGSLFSAGLMSIRAREFCIALTHTSNFFVPSWNLLHTWSLSVEEQFYLLWPATIVLLGRRRALRAAFALVLLAPVFRVALWRFGTYHGSYFPAVADSLAVGCLLAGSRRELSESPRYMALMESRLFALVPLALVAVLWARHWILLSHAALQSIENVLIALCLDWCLRNPSGRIGAVLNSRPLVFVGGLSYSLYLFQQPFMNAAMPATLTTFPLNLFAAFGAGILCHYAVEQPVLRWRERVEQWWNARLSARAVPEQCGDAG
jgi:peptidoglycan/LPS O-acetylase OafA/YrhL